MYATYCRDAMEKSVVVQFRQRILALSAGNNNAFEILTLLHVI